MALEAFLDTLDGVDDAVKGLYVENDGKFALDVNGGIPDVATLESTLSKVREELKEKDKGWKEQKAQLDGMDMEKYREAIELAEKAEAERVAAEEQKLLDANNAEQVWAGRTGKLNSEWQSKLDAQAELTNNQIEINKKLKLRALEGELSMQLVGVDGMHDFGKRDALNYAIKQYTLADDGKAVMLDSNGNAVIGKDGKTNFSFGEEARSAEFRDKNPHWYTASGGGSGLVQGQTGISHGSKTISRTEFLNLSPKAQSKATADGYKIVGQ